MKQHRFIRPLFLGVILLCIFVMYSCGGDSGGGIGEPPRGNSPYPSPTTTVGTWLEYLNMFRQQANLPQVLENASYSLGAYNHSRYMVKNDVITHDEIQTNQYFTIEGAGAGQNSNVFGTTATSITYVEPMNMWMTGAFHGVALIDPMLIYAGYGQYSEADGGIQSAATLNVLQGRTGDTSFIQFPVMWPGNGKTVDLHQYTGNESPDPLSGSGYTPPTGLPVYLLLGPGNVVPMVTAHSFSRNGVELPHIIFDESTYTNPNIDLQSLGRNVLAMRNAIVLIPRDPLEGGATYQVSITTNGITYTWYFTIAATPQHLRPGSEVSEIK